jgi:hypothetical protein
MANFGLEFVDAVVDGLHIEVHAPRALRDALWTSWEKAFMCCIIVVTNLQGVILYISPLQRRNEEQGIINDIKVRSYFAELGMGVLGDSKFCFNTAKTVLLDYVKHAFTVGPTVLNRLRSYCNVVGDLGEFCRRWLRNTKLASQMRIVAENTISRARQWKIISYPFRHLHAENGRYTPDFDTVVRVAMTLTNRQILETPCRPDEWMPAARLAYETGEGELKMWENKENFQNSVVMRAHLTKLIDAAEMSTESIVRLATNEQEEDVVSESMLPPIVTDEDGVYSDDETVAWKKSFENAYERRKRADLSMFHGAMAALAAAEAKKRRKKTRRDDVDGKTSSL